MAERDPDIPDDSTTVLPAVTRASAPDRGWVRGAAPWIGFGLLAILVITGTTTWAAALQGSDVRTAAAPTLLAVPMPTPEEEPIDEEVAPLNILPEVAEPLPAEPPVLEPELEPEPEPEPAASSRPVREQPRTTSARPPAAPRTSAAAVPPPAAAPTSAAKKSGEADEGDAAECAGCAAASAPESGDERDDDKKTPEKKPEQDEDE